MQVTVKRSVIARLSARGTSARKEHGPLIANALMHLVNDGCFVAIYPVLPLIAKEFHLSYTQVGFLKTALTGSSTALQLPMAMLAERFGDITFLALGMAWVAAGLMIIGVASSFLQVLMLTWCAGSGALPTGAAPQGARHPRGRCPAGDGRRWPDPDGRQGPPCHSLGGAEPSPVD